MTRCNYDTIFQRVFCVTLVAIAFTFTVILTNVFIDIDGLLSRKDKVKSINNLETLDNAKRLRLSPNAIAPKPFKTEKNYEEETEESYRNKRSLESQNFLFHIKNPKMKSILTSRLATLLEELDEEETSPHIKEKVETKSSSENEKKKENKEEDSNFLKDIEKKSIEGLKTDSKKRLHVRDRNEEDLLHLAMHNILLQGIIGHMDLDDVYRKIHLLVNNFKLPVNEKDKIHKDTRKHIPITPHIELTANDVLNKANLIETMNPEIKAVEAKVPENEEWKFFDELAECDKLQNELAEKGHEVIKEPTSTKRNFKLPNVLIKTIIDISSRNKSQSNSNAKENVKGIIQLIYNGQSIKFSRMDEDSNVENLNEKVVEQTTESSSYKGQRSPIESEISEVIDNLHDKFKEKHSSDSYLSKIITEYIKKNPKSLSNKLSEIEGNLKYNTKRYKRQIKISYDDNDLADKIKPKRKPLTKPDDDELYVEIETHFDSKGLKGEKKKKLIRNLIQKIQKAIHSDIDIITEERKKKHKHNHYKKRTQHPLDKNRTVFINKVMIPFEAIIQRHSDPISKSIPENQPVPLIMDKSGESWRKEYFGPGFLAVSKSLNSAELGEVEVDYNKVVALHGIPQRVQKPLNTEASEELANANTYNNLGNLKFFVKNLDGAGLSIGFNQYMDEPPDPETMKVFTGVENIIQNYQNSAEVIERDRNNQEHKAPIESLERGNDITTRDITKNNEHVVIRRSVKELNNKDYHSNEYKIIFDSNYTPYNSYDEVIRDKKKKVSLSISNNNHYNVNRMDLRKNIDIDELPALLGDNIFYQKLKPSEILSLASMLNRKKRSVSVKKISKLRNKMKLSKFINTKKKKVILNKKRSKRQIDKIRIIATDALGKARQSAENIFLVSNENMLTDRAILREVEPPDGVRGMRLSDIKSENNYHNVIPYTYDETPVPSQFQNSFRPSSLMSRYPHVFMEDLSRSNEEYDPVMINKIEIKPVLHTRKRMDEKTTEANTTPIDLSVPKVEEILGALSPNPKQNYKLTVKIVPKNISDLNSGFKEIHTSINKSFNKNGLVYSSLVNVSEISKVEKMYNALDDLSTTTTKPAILSTRSCFNKKLGEQQSKMDLLLKQHKQKIDDQLEHLKKERLHLENLAQKNLHEGNNKAVEFSTKASLLPQIAKFDIGQLVASALLHLQGESEFSTATTSPTSTTQTTVTTTVEQADPLKTRMMSTIEKNEMLTNEILQQINKNTDILQKFLSKLTDKLFPPTAKPAEEIKQIYEDPNKFWRPYAVPFMPTAEYAKNMTNERVPLVYAFQQPYTNKQNMPNMQNIQNFPVGNAMYNGHIDSNHREVWQYKPKEQTANVTKGKYFMDGLDSGYKTVLAKKKDPTVQVPTLQVITKNITILP